VTIRAEEVSGGCDVTHLFDNCEIDFRLHKFPQEGVLSVLNEVDELDQETFVPQVKHVRTPPVQAT